MNAIYKFEPDAHYLRTLIRRYRQQQPLLLRPEGQFAIVILMLLGVSLYGRVIAAPWQSVVNVTLLIAVVVSVASIPFISHMAQRRAESRANPKATITVTLSEGGIHGAGPTATTELDWQAYSRAVRYADGIMLIRKGSIRWLPDAALQDPVPDVAIKLVSSKLPLRFVA
jgi:hypothetical protein